MNERMCVSKYEISFMNTSPLFARARLEYKEKL